MKAVVFDKKIQLVTDYPKPVPAPDEALLRVILAGICSTDLEITKGYMGFSGILGHEFVAIVEECADPSLTGRRVTGEINIGCGKCRWCEDGLGNHCPTRQVLGIARKDGAMAEYLTLPIENLHIVPDSVSDEMAVLTEPLAAAFEITERHTISPSDKVCVLGGGRLGTLSALALRETGCDLTVAGRNPAKNKIIKDLGLNVVLPEALKGGFDYVVDCTGSPNGLNIAISLTKPLGTIILKTTVAKPAPADLNNIVINEINISGSRCGPFKSALDFLDKYSEGFFKDIVSGVYPLEDAIEAFSAAKSKGVMKMILKTDVKR